MKRVLLLTCLAWAITASAQLPSYVPTDGLILWSNLNASSLEFNLDGATPTLGRFGVENSGLAFDGIDDKASISLPNLPAGNDSRSVSIWFYLQGENNLVGNGQKTIFHSGIVSYNQRFCVLHWNSGLRTVGQGNDACNGCGGTEFLQYIPTPIGTWHHMCVTHNGTTTKMYINGTLSYSANKSYNTNQNGGTFWLGFSQENHHSGEPFLGILDDVGLWSRALNPDEVDSLFNASAPVLGCTDMQSCNFDSDANVNNGSCIPSGCMEEGACNYNADAECEGEACDYSCCPGPGCCGEGMHWDAAAQTCVITPPSIPPNGECTLLNLQELAEGYQILQEAVEELQLQLDSCSQQPNQNENPGSENSCLAATSDYDSITPIFLGQLLDVNYYSIGPNLTWNEAQTIAQCISPNCHLATVHSSSENSIFTSWTQEFETQEHWIGLYQNFNSSSYSEPSGGWEWVDGSPETYRNWAGPEPNNGSQFEHHAHMNHVNWGLGVWNDGHGDLYRFRALIQLPTAESALLD